jgi:hypothetical protein
VRTPHPWQWQSCGEHARCRSQHLL